MKNLTKIKFYLLSGRGRTKGNSVAVIAKFDPFVR